MAKDYVFKSYFYGIERFDSEFDDALGQLNAIKLGMKPKRPDKARLKAALEKSKKKGEFVLSRDGDEIEFLVRIGSERFVLAKLDLAAVRDTTKRRDLLFQLEQRTDLVTKDELKAFDEKHADVEDRPEAVELNKRIDALKQEIDNRQSMLGAANYKGKEYNEWSSEFKEWIKKKGHQRYTAFVDDVKNNRLGGDAAKLLADPKTSGIKPATLKAIVDARARGETPDFTQARKEVLVVVNALLQQFNREKIAEHQGRIKTAVTEIAALQKQLKVMKAD